MAYSIVGSLVSLNPSALSKQVFNLDDINAVFLLWEAIYKSLQSWSFLSVKDVFVLELNMIFVCTGANFKSNLE